MNPQAPKCALPLCSRIANFASQNPDGSFRHCGNRVLKILAPAVDRQEAEQVIRKTLRRRFLVAPGKLKRVELIHVPFHAFRCHIEDKPEDHVVVGVGDALEGQYAATLRKYDELPADAEVQLPSPQLDPDAVHELVVDHVRWLMIQGKLFRIHSGELRECEYTGSLAYPFWVGYVKRGERYNIQVVDAISGERTGPQLRRLLLLAVRLLAEQQT